MPVRYVLAVLLAAALLGIGFVALDHVSTSNSQQHMESEIAQIEESAVSLIENEDLPPHGHEGAQRVITIELPNDSLLSEPVEFFEIRRTHTNGSIAEYRFEGGPTHQRHIDAPIVSESDESIEFRGTGTEYDAVLILERDDDDRPVVKIET